MVANKTTGNGKAMFLEVEAMSDVYARMPQNANPRPGDQMTFRLFPAFDKKHDRYTEAAIHVRPRK